MEKPEIPQKAPYGILMQPGSYKWCTCGLSNTQPFCDDAHYGTGFEPLLVEIEEEKQVWWCGCKHSKKAPFCDGAHRNV